MDESEPQRLLHSGEVLGFHVQNQVVEEVPVVLSSFPGGREAVMILASALICPAFMQCAETWRDAMTGLSPRDY